MNLSQYLAQPNISKAAFARSINVSSALLYQWEHGKRPVAPQHCPAIETVTMGQVTRQELRPEDWQQIWPDLATKRRKKPANPIP